MKIFSWCNVCVLAPRNLVISTTHKAQLGFMIMLLLSQIFGHNWIKGNVELALTLNKTLRDQQSYYNSSQLATFPNFLFNTY